jgi:molybdopterin-guanine dinucleotide biosynthesis protein A
MSAGVLLTGGSSSRMGRDKARLRVDGEPYAERTARILSAVCDPVIEVGDGASGLPCVREDPPGAGPLAALLAGTRALGLSRPEPILVLACDLPFIDVAFLSLLADYDSNGSVLPIVAGEPQYTCARWSPSALSSAQSAYERGERAMRALLLAEDAVLLPADAYADVLADVDTPDDLLRRGLS